MRVPSSRIIAGGVLARHLYMILSLSEFARSCLWIIIQSTLAMSLAWLRSVQYPHKTGQCAAHCVGHIQPPQCQTKVDGLVSGCWQQHLAIHRRLRQDVSRGSGMGSCLCFCSTLSAHKSKLRGSLMSKTDGLEDHRGLAHNGGVGTRYCAVSTEVQGIGAAGVRYPMMRAGW